MSSPEQPRYLTVSQAAQVMRVSESLIRTWVRTGFLKSVKERRFRTTYHRIDRDEVRRVMLLGEYPVEMLPAE